MFLRFFQCLFTIFLHQRLRMRRIYPDSINPMDHIPPIMSVKKFQPKVIRIITSIITKSCGPQHIDKNIIEIIVLDYLRITEKELRSIAKREYVGGFRWNFYVVLGRIVKNIGMSIYLFIHVFQILLYIVPFVVDIDLTQLERGKSARVLF